MSRFQKASFLRSFLPLLFPFTCFLVDAQEVCHRDWLTAPYARCYGQNGLEAVDLDGDGMVEIVSMATDLWKVLRFDSFTEGYVEEYVHGVIAGEVIYHLTAGDVDGDGFPEIITAGSEGIEVFSGSDYGRLSQFDLPSSYINDLLLDDVDNDGVVEWLFSTRQHIYVMEVAGGQITRELPFGAQWLRLGQVDADAPREIVTSNGRVIELSTVSYEIEWDRAYTTDRMLALGDIDGDGVAEIVEAGDERIEVFNARTQIREDWYKTDGAIDALAVLDLAGDARAEILCHRVNSGYLQGLSTYTGDPVWQASVWAGRINDLVIHDTDGDGKPEVISAEGCPADQPSFLRVLKMDGSTAWQSREAAGPCRAVELRDVNGDGREEIVALSSQASEEGVLLSVYDAETKALLWHSPAGAIPTPYTDLQALIVADVDQDAGLEIVVGGGSGIGPRLWIFSGSDFRLERINQYPGSGRSAIQAMATGDLDGDGQPEIVACTGEENLLLSGPELSQIRSFGTAVHPVSRVFIENVDEDTAPEIIIHRRYPYLFDSAASALLWGGPDDALPLRTIDVTDYNGDGRREVVGFDGADSILVLEGTSGARIHTQAVAVEQAGNFRAGDLNGDGRAEWLFSSDTQVFFFDQQGRHWQTPPLGTALGRHEAFKLSDGDGRPELYLGHAFGVLSLDRSCLSSCLSVELHLSAHPAGSPGVTNGRAKVEVSGGQAPLQYEWSSGETTSQTRGITPGNYTVTVTDAAGCTVSAAVKVGIAPPGTPVLPDIDLPPGTSPPPGSGAPVKVFPNPAGGMLTIVWPEPAQEGLQLRLTDVLGRTWKQIAPPSGSRGIKLSLESLPDGLYFLVGDHGGNSYRIPVQKTSF